MISQIVIKEFYTLYMLEKYGLIRKYVFNCVIEIMAVDVWNECKLGAPVPNILVVKCGVHVCR